TRALPRAGLRRGWRRFRRCAYLVWIGVRSLRSLWHASLWYAHYVRFGTLRFGTLTTFALARSLRSLWHASLWYARCAHFCGVPSSYQSVRRARAKASAASVQKAEGR